LKIILKIDFEIPEIFKRQQGQSEVAFQSCRISKLQIDLASPSKENFRIFEA